MGKRVMIPGCFDYFHIGHFKVLQKAKQEGGFLTVAIHKDTANVKNVEYIYSVEERAMIINAFDFVDNIIFYESLDQLVKDHKDDFDILCHGPDNKSDVCLRAYDWCNNNGKDVVEICRTSGISSTKLRNFIEESLN